MKPKWLVGSTGTMICGQLWPVKDFYDAVYIVFRPINSMG